LPTARSTACCDSIGTSETVQDHGQESLCFREFVGDSSTKLEGERCRGSCPNDDRTGQKRNCILADEREQLVRITIIQTGQTSTRVVLFQGATESIYSALPVSSFTFRINWFPLPYHVFQWWTLLVTYILNLSLAMAILNMLPLPSLDGDVYFQFMLKTLISRYHTTDDEISTPNRQDNRDEEENINGIELGAMVTSRPESPTQLRRPSSTNKFAFDGSQQTRYRQSNTLAQSSHRLSHNRILTKIHQRLQWVTIFFAVFVFGGSILLHAVKEVE
jgi:membrane-associated protease RseP (regulator of RpoE activity)